MSTTTTVEYSIENNSCYSLIGFMQKISKNSSILIYLSTEGSEGNNPLIYNCSDVKYASETISREFKKISIFHHFPINMKIIEHDTYLTIKIFLQDQFVINRDIFGLSESDKELLIDFVKMEYAKCIELDDTHKSPTEIIRYVHKSKENIMDPIKNLDLDFEDDDSEED